MNLTEPVLPFVGLLGSVTDLLASVASVGARCGSQCLGSMANLGWYVLNKYWLSIYIYTELYIYILIYSNMYINFIVYNYKYIIIIIIIIIIIYYIINKW